MKTTIDMAREAGFALDVSTDPNSPPSWWGAGHEDRFKAFEALVRADEREQGQKWFDAVTAQHKQLILAEREACAKVCDDLPTPERMSLDNESLWEAATLDCADAIRARGQA
jgi:hypothetical protein